MGRKTKKPRNKNRTKENPIFQSDALLFKGESMAAGSSSDASHYPNLADSNPSTCNNVAITISGGIGFVGGTHNNSTFVVEGGGSSTGREMMVAGSATESIQHPNLSGWNSGMHSNHNNVAVNITGGIGFVGGSHNNHTFVVGGGSSAGSEVMVAGSATDDSWQPDPDDWNPGNDLLSNCNNYSITISGGIGFIGGHHNTFVFGGGSSGVGSGSRSRYQMNADALDWISDEEEDEAGEW